MVTPSPLQMGILSPTLIIGVVFTAVGLVLAVQPERSISPLGGDVESSRKAVKVWGRIVATGFLLLGVLLTVIGTWNILYA